MTDWTSFTDLPRARPNYGKCDVCGRRDETVRAIVYIRDYNPGEPFAPRWPPPEPRRCPLLCSFCLEDEPTSEDLARKVIG